MSYFLARFTENSIHVGRSCNMMYFRRYDVLVRNLVTNTPGSWIIVYQTPNAYAATGKQDKREVTINALTINNTNHYKLKTRAICPQSKI